MTYLQLFWEFDAKYPEQKRTFFRNIAFIIIQKNIIPKKYWYFIIILGALTGSSIRNYFENRVLFLIYGIYSDYISHFLYGARAEDWKALLLGHNSLCSLSQIAPYLQMLMSIDTAWLKRKISMENTPKISRLQHSFCGSRVAVVSFMNFGGICHNTKFSPQMNGNFVTTGKICDADIRWPSPRGHKIVIFLWVAHCHLREPVLLPPRQYFYGFSSEASLSPHKNNKWEKDLPFKANWIAVLGKGRVPQYLIILYVIPDGNTNSPTLLFHYFLSYIYIYR